MNLVQIYKLFPDNQSCIDHLHKKRWPDSPVCPYCGSRKHSPLKKELNRHHCNNCNTHYSVTVGTIFHDTKLDLQKWFLAICLVLNAKKGISSRQLARDLGVNKNTAWRIQMQIRRAMIEDFGFLNGICEADETFVGGKENKHKNKKTPGGQGRSTKTKQPVVGVVQRDGKVKARKVKDTKGKTLKSFLSANVEKGTKIMTDEWKGYLGLSKNFDHYVIKHSQNEYVRGNIHTNTIENFWSLLKRGIIGQYHHLSAKYLDRYIDEFCFRLNNRDKDMFDLVILNGVSM